MDRQEAKIEGGHPPTSSDEVQSTPEKGLQSEPNASPAVQEPEWVSGIKLLTIIAAITVVCFLMLLDTSIIVTV
jgi:hypothetical protein